MRLVGALRHAGFSIAASISVCATVAITSPAARAGTIWVTDGNMNAGQTGSCGAFGAGGDFAEGLILSSCPMSLEAIELPQWQAVTWSTTAPPGITINSAWTANGDVNSGGIADGYVAEDFWYTGGAWHGSILAPGQQWFNTSLEGSSDIDSQIYGFQIACTENLLSGGCYPPWPTLTTLTVSGIELEGTENSAPYVTGEGSLWGNGIVRVESAGRLVARNPLRERRLWDLLIRRLP